MGRSRRRRLPALADDPVAERLDTPPPRTPPARLDPHEKMRRRLIAAPGQWLVLATRAPLSEATARRLARSYTRAKPARLDPAATGTFHARPFTRDGKWLLAATYQPPDADRLDDPEPTGGETAPAPPAAAPGPDR